MGTQQRMTEIDSRPKAMPVHLPDQVQRNLRFGSTAKVLAKRMLKYYRISECSVPVMRVIPQLSQPGRLPLG